MCGSLQIHSNSITIIPFNITVSATDIINITQINKIKTVDNEAAGMLNLGQVVCSYTLFFGYVNLKVINL
jgi:hypothetical protein